MKHIELAKTVEQITQQAKKTELNELSTKEKQLDSQVIFGDERASTSHLDAKLVSCNFKHVVERASQNIPNIILPLSVSYGYR